MATVSDSVNSPRSSSVVINSTAVSPRTGRTHPNPPPVWANIVRGESESVPAAPSSPSPSPSPSASPSPPSSLIETPDFDVKVSSPSIDISAAEAPPDISDSGNSNASKSKKPAWTKPSNSGAPVEVSPLMGSVSWPALADSAKASPKSSAALADGSASPVQGPVVATPQQKPVPVHVNANPNSTPSHQFPRQKSFRRNQAAGGSASASASANGGLSQTTTQPPAVEASPNNSTKTAPPSGSSPRDPPHKSHNWEGGQRPGFVSQSSSGNDHQQPRNSYRRGGGGHHRGDGSNHYNHGNRREQDRPNLDSNSSRGFNGRDGHMQPRVNQRNFNRPPSTAPFISQPPVRPFANHMGFPDMASPMYIVPNPPPESLRGVSFFPPPIVFVPAPDPQRTMLAKQIEYYFSPDNLCKDIYLRNHMDIQGWVPISVIADFNRVKQLTNNLQFIVDSVRASTVVEVQGDKIRKRNDWMNWTLLPSSPASRVDALPSSANHADALANHIQSVGLEEGNIANGNGKGPGDAHPQAVLMKSSSGNWNQSNPFNGERQDRVQH